MKALFSLAALATLCACASTDYAYAGDPYGDSESYSTYSASGGGDYNFADDSIDGDLVRPQAIAMESMSTSGKRTKSAAPYRGGNTQRTPPPPPPPAPLPPGEQAPPQTDIDENKDIEANKRLVIYTGSLSLMVAQTEVAVVDFMKHIEGIGGYLQARNGTTLTVRIPAQHFFATVDKVRTSGQLVGENISSQDVTKRVFDLELRRKTAEEAHKRLVKLLENATKMEDILAIETQLRRLTEEIEGMKSELANLADQVAYSTLTVSFSANAPQARPYPTRTRSRFEWINKIGIEPVLHSYTDDSGESCWWIGIDAPDRFLAVYNEWGSQLLLTPEEARLWLRDFDDDTKGSLAFWRDALKADLQKSRGYTIIDEGEIIDGKGRKGLLFTLETSLSGRPVRELLAVFVIDGLFSNTIRTVEFVADKEPFATEVDSVKAAIATVR